MDQLDGLELLFGSPAGGVMPVQQAVPRPAPVPRPGVGGGPQAPQAQPQPLDGLGLLFGGPQPAAPAPQVAQPPAPGTPQPEPDAKTWLGRRWQDFKGREDPRYVDTPTIAEVTIRENINNPLSETGAWALAAEDKDMVSVYQNMLGNRYLGTETDANGYPLVVYRGKTGQPEKAYVNKPGLDPQDIMRGAFGIAPFVGAGRLTNALMRGSGIGLRATGQALTQGVTSVAQDVGGTAAGVREFDYDNAAIKAGVAAAGGAAGEFAGAGLAALYRRFVTEPRLFDQAAGRLTSEGIKAAREAGLDPAAFSQEFAAEFARQVARTGSARQATTFAANREFGIPRTRGEFTGNQAQLIREQRIRGGNFGPDSAAIIKGVDDAQVDAVRNAIFGEIKTGTTTKPGIAQQLAPGRTGADYGKDAIGTAIRQNTQAARQAADAVEDVAWQQVPRNITPQDGALPLLQQRINDAVGDFDILPDGVAARMIKQVGSFVRQEAPTKVDDILTTSPIGDVGKMRKMLTNTLKDAQTPSDRMAAGAVYDAFNTWVREAAEQGLLQGADAVGVANMTTARGISRQIHEVFDGQRGTAGARILSDVLKKSDSPEGVVNALFTGPTTEIKGGSIAAIRSLKEAYDRYLPPEAAKAAWDDIRLAYFLRLIPGATVDNAIGVQKLQSNILGAFQKQRSALNELYTPQEQAMLRRFATEALRGIEKKNINRSWSGIAAGDVVNDTIKQIIASFGFNSVAARTAWNFTVGRRAAEAYGTAAANRATRQVLPALPLPSYGGAGGGAAASSQE